MSRLALIRLATYAILLACAIGARERRYFIPIDLPPLVLDGNAFDLKNPDYRGGFSPTLLPGFADTRRSGSEVMRSAIAVIEAANISLAKYRDPQVTLQLVGVRLSWQVSWTEKMSNYRSPDLVIDVDDETGLGQIKK